MSSVAVALRVPPRVALVPDHAYTDFAEALEIARMLGLDLDDWQEFALEVMLARTSDERWAAPEVGLISSRQGGKGVVIEVRALTGPTRLEEELVIWTAHEYKTAREGFLRVRDHVEGSEEFYDEHVLKIRTANGEESIEFRNGARLRFLARTAGSGRGFSGDAVMLDEAYKVQPEQMAALMPTLAARPDPQIVYASMAGLLDSEVLRGVRDRALAEAERLAWLEWSAPEGADLDDEDVWAAANPAMPHRISPEFVRQERAALTDEDFARERLCMWGSAIRQTVIDADLWAGLADVRSRPTGPEVAFAVAVPPEGRAAAVARAGRRADGHIHVEVDIRAGTSWAVTRLVALAKKRKAPVVLNPASRAGSLIADLALGRVKPHLVSLRDRAAACGAFVDLCEEKDLRHMGQPELTVALDGAVKRAVGDAWVWQRRDDTVDLSPLEAATLAVHGLRSKSPKRKTGRAMAV